MTGPVYAKSDKKTDIQYKSVSDNERKYNIEDSVISDGDRELE